MGHMGDEKYTITVYSHDHNQIFNDCYDVNASERELRFTDKDDKEHEFFGLSYHIVQQ